MTSNDAVIDALNLKLKSATKLKLLRARSLFTICNLERAMTEEIAVIKSENDFTTELLQDLNIQIAQAIHQLSMIKICSTSDNFEINAHIRNLENHKNGFQDTFDREQKLHLKEIKEKEEAEELILQQKMKDIAERNERNAKEAVAVEAECEAIDRECAVLKKRNNAIMLKLRRKLMETENTRRQLLKGSATLKTTE